MDIEIITTLDELKGIEKDWNTLIQNTYTRTIFQTFEMNFLWLKHFSGKELLMKIILAKEKGKLVGIAPLFIKNRVLQFIGTHLFDYADLIVHEKHKDALPALLDAVQELDFVRVHLFEIPQGSYTLDILKENALLSSEIYRFVPRGATVEENLEEFGCLKRKIFKRRRKLKQFVRSDSCIFKKAQDYDEFKRFYAKLKEFHIRRWKDTGTPSYFSDPVHDAFFDELYAVLFDKGLMNIYAIYDNDVLVSAEVIFFYDDTYYNYTTTYDYAFKRISPGNANNISIIEDAIRNNMTFDFTRGDEPYKKEYANTISANYEIEIAKSQTMSLFVSAKKVLLSRIRQKKGLHKRLKSAHEITQNIFRAKGT